MRHFIYFLASLLLCLLFPLSLIAQQFSATNADGVTIYYNQLSSSECEVIFSPKYSGDINIPATVTNDDVTLSVTSIGNGAFEYRLALTSITIPSSVTSIGRGAFERCPSLSSITIDPANPNFSSLDGVLFNKDQTTIVCCPGGKQGEYVLPYSVTAIGDEAFCYCESLTTVNIHSNVTSIGCDAFECSSITSITIPNSVTSFGTGVFSGCSSLTSVILPNSLTSIGAKTFYSCYSLTSINIPSSVTSIGISAFQRCESLTSITIPDGVTSIGSEAFHECRSLNSISLPRSLTSIGNDAFWSCESLTSITLPSRLFSIGSGVFFRCTSLTSITFSNSVTHIGNGVFGGCSSLSSVINLANTPQQISDWGFDNYNTATLYVSTGTKSLYAAADVWRDFGAIVEIDPADLLDHDFSATNADGVTIFYNKLSATECEVTYGSTYYSDSVSIPASVTYAGSTYSVTSIGIYAFMGCSYLTSLSLPNSLISIGNWAFDGCTSLTSVTLPNCLTFIGNGAFENCTALTSVTLPSSLTSISNWAFSDCTSLTSVTNLATTPQWIEYVVFAGVPLSSATLYVPSGTKFSYAYAEGWHDFGQIIELAPEPIPVETIILSDTELYLNLGDTYTITATVLPDDATDSTLSWSSSNETVAMVASSGKVVATGYGTAVVTATANDGSGISASCSITVNQVMVQQIQLSTDYLELTVGENATIQATVLPADASIQTLSWSSGKEEVALVSSQGNVVAIAPGYAVITASATDGSNISATAIVAVKQAESSIAQVTKPSFHLTKHNQTLTLSGIDDGTEVYLYNPSGTLLGYGVSMAETLTFTLPSTDLTGIYLLRIDGILFKVTI